MLISTLKILCGPSDELGQARLAFHRVDSPTQGIEILLYVVVREE